MFVGLDVYADGILGIKQSFLNVSSLHIETKYKYVLLLVTCVASLVNN